MATAGTLSLSNCQVRPFLAISAPRVSLTYIVKQANLPSNQARELPGPLHRDDSGSVRNGQGCRNSLISMKFQMLNSPMHDPLGHYNSSTRGRPGPRLALPSYFFAINIRNHRKTVSGVTSVHASPSNLRPNGLPLAASRRRWSSVKRIRLPLSCSRRTRFSSRRYSTISCCCRFSHPASATTMNCHV